MIAEHEEIVEPTEEPFNPTMQGSAYRILKCAGCNTIFFQREHLKIFGNDLSEDSIIGFADFKDYVAYLNEFNPTDILEEETSYWPVPPHIQRARPDWHKLPDDVLIKLLNYSARAYAPVQRSRRGWKSSEADRSVTLF